MKTTTLFSFLLGISCVLGTVFCSGAPINNAPSFTGGASQDLTACQNLSTTIFTSLLAINDLDIGQTETWTIVSSPTHGTISGLSSTATSTGGTVVPSTSDITYTPVAGYLGGDVFTVQVSDGIATTTTVVHVTVMSLPDAGIITGKSSVCAVAPITLTVTVTGGEWSSTDTLLAISGTGQVFAIAPDSSGTVTINYFVTNACGISVASKILAVNPIADAGTIIGDSDICVGASVPLSIYYSTTVVDTNTGFWTSANNSISSVSASGVVTGIASGPNIISYTLVNACDTSVAIFLMTVDPVPVPASILGLSELCPDYAIILTDSFATPGGAWTSSNASATVSDGLVIGVSGGVDTITYSIVNSCGSASATKIITVNSYPFAGVISGPTVYCVGQIDTLASTGYGGTWSTTNATAAITGSGEILALEPGDDTVSYIVTNLCGTSVTRLPIFINPTPNTTVHVDSAICVGSTYTVTADSAGGIWSFSNTHATFTAGHITGVTTGWDTLTYKLTNACTTDSSRTPVHIITLPVVPAITGASAVCIAASITLTDAMPGGTWAVTNAAAGITSLGVVSGIAAGTDTTKYTATNMCGSNTVKKTVTINTPPVVAAISGTSALCAGLDSMLTETTTGGTWSSTNAAATISTGGMLAAIYGGTDTIKYTLSNSCGSVSSVKIITIHPLPAVDTIAGAASICTGITIPFTDGSAGGIWTSSSAHATVTTAGAVKGISVGIDTIRYAITNACGTTTKYQVVDVITLPQVGAIAGIDTVCPGHVVTLSDTALGGVWNSYFNTIASISSSGIVTGLTPGVDTILYSITNACGTTSTKFRLRVLSIEECSHINGVATIPGAADEEMQLYPNPNSGTFSIKLSSGIDEPLLLVITNVAGEQVREITTATNKVNEIDINVAPGIYIIDASTAHGRHVARIAVE